MKTKVGKYVDKEWVLDNYVGDWHNAFLLTDGYLYSKGGDKLLYVEVVYKTEDTHAWWIRGKVEFDAKEKHE